MFDGITATTILDAAGPFAAMLIPLAVIVIGFGVTLRLLSWGISKFRS